MSLETTLTDITAKLRQGKFPSACHPESVESRVGRDGAVVSAKSQPTGQGIVLRVLQELGCGTWDIAHED